MVVCMHWKVEDQGTVQKQLNGVSDKAEIQV